MKIIRSVIYRLKSVIYFLLKIIRSVIYLLQNEPNTPSPDERVASLSTFSDSQYTNLRNIKWRTVSSLYYPFFKVFARLTNLSLDFFVIDLNDPNPELYTLNQTDESLYKRIQIEGNIRKLNNRYTGWDVRVKPIVEDIIKKTTPQSNSVKGVCMGARNGNEVIAFNNLLKQTFARLNRNGNLQVEVIGTDISPSAALFENMVVHDFHNPLPDNIGKVNFIYSNSLDQSNDPRKALLIWVDSLLPGGVIYLEFSRMHGKKSFSLLDPFSCETELFPFIFLKWMDGKAFIEKILFPLDNSSTSGIYIILPSHSRNIHSN